MAMEASVEEVQHVRYVPPRIGGPLITEMIQIIVEVVAKWDGDFSIHKSEE